MVEYLTVDRAAERLEVCEEVVRRWLRAGRLRGTLLNRRAGYRIPAAEVERVLRGEPVPAGDAAAGEGAGR